MTRLPELRDSLVRTAADAAPPVTRRHSRVRLAVAGALGVVVLGGVAVAATTIIQTGAPVKSRGTSSLIGKIEPGSARLLSLRVPDPDGGPPWGIRVFRTTDNPTNKGSRLACVQVGRVVNGKLGILGQDGSFADDGKFHELPTEADACGGLDPRDQLFISAVVPLTASAYPPGPGCETPAQRRYRTIEKPRTLRAALRSQLNRGERQAARIQRRLLGKARREARRTLPLCSARDIRTVAFGMVGTRAKKVTATRGPNEMSLRPAAAESGPYLFVFRGGTDVGRVQVQTLYPAGASPRNANPRPPRGAGPSARTVTTRP